jgi:8-oxo-dGTP diphosphatase
MTRPVERPIIVTAAVIERDGCFLLTRRPEGKHMAGHWEFPGGKCEDGEQPERGLQRELREELDVDAVVAEELFRTRYRYEPAEGTARHLDLDLRFFRCVLDGVPRPVQGQAMQWVPRAALTSLPFPPADAEFIARLTGDGLAG